jgi:hypothetical protein
MKLKNAKDFWSGVMFVAFGLFFAGFARQYDMGTSARMGPAYFPTVLGLLLIAIGLYIGFKGLRFEAEDGHGQVDRFHFKPLLLVLGGVVAFGVLLRPAGMIIALSAMILIASFGSGEFKWREIVPLMAGLALLVWVMFIWGLGLTIPVLPAFMQN